MSPVGRLRATVPVDGKTMAMTPGKPARGTESVHARVFTFHVTSEQLDAVSTALDAAAAELSLHPDFRGLLYLERGETRLEVLGLTLWAGDGIDETEPNAERSRQRIADMADTGVSSRSYKVVRQLPCPPPAPVVGRFGGRPMADAG